MALTSAQWNALQNRLPPSERTPYSEYVAATATSATSAAITEPWYGAGTQNAPTVGWTKAGTIITLEGPVAVDANGRAANGSIPISATTPTPTPTPIPPKVPVTPSLTAADMQAAVDKAINANNLSWQTKFDELTKKQSESNRIGTTTALQDFTASLTSAGLGTLATAVSNMILQDKTAAQIKIDIVKEPAYISRFPGMAKLAEAGKAVSEATYISMERSMVNVLKAYGLDANILGTTEKLGAVIGAQVSPTEYEQRVQLAADHVKKNTDVLASLNEYYGVDIAGAMSYLLDPKTGMDIINKQVRASEIGAAAEMYQFNVDKAAAESYVNVAGSADLNSLKQSFGKARLLADTQSRLSSIEGGKYNELESVATILGQDSVRMLESQRRALREQARFAGQSGITGSSLKTESNI